MKYGKAELGDRTLVSCRIRNHADPFSKNLGAQVDALLPALETFHSGSSINETLDLLLSASSAAEEGAEKTAGMRAKYVFFFQINFCLIF